MRKNEIFYVNYEWIKGEVFNFFRKGSVITKIVE